MKDDRIGCRAHRGRICVRDYVGNRLNPAVVVTLVFRLEIILPVVRGAKKEKVALTDTRRCVSYVELETT